jgi:hypothetical protein
VINVRRCTGQPFAAGLTRPSIPNQDHGRLTLRELTIHQQTHRQSLYQTVVTQMGGCANIAPLVPNPQSTPLRFRNHTPYSGGTTKRRHARLAYR